MPVLIRKSDGGLIPLTKKLTTKPASMGSPTVDMTIGIVFVALWAALMLGVVAACFRRVSPNAAMRTRAPP